MLLSSATEAVISIYKKNVRCYSSQFGRLSRFGWQVSGSGGIPCHVLQGLSPPQRHRVSKFVAALTLHGGFIFQMFKHINKDRGAHQEFSKEALKGTKILGMA